VSRVIPKRNLGARESSPEVSFGLRVVDRLYERKFKGRESRRRVRLVIEAAAAAAANHNSVRRLCDALGRRSNLSIA
jgi:hypothetical protein